MLRSSANSTRFIPSDAYTRFKFSTSIFVLLSTVMFLFPGGIFFLSCMHCHVLFVLHLGITRNAGKTRKLYLQIPTSLYARVSARDCSSRIHAYTCSTSISQELHTPDQDVHARGRSCRSPSYKRRYPASCLLFILRECASSLLFRIYER